MAHKKGASSTRNGRDSNSHPGDGVGRGGDDTLFALVEGKVDFGTRRGRRVVNILPAEATTSA